MVSDKKVRKSAPRNDTYSFERFIAQEHIGLEQAKKFQHYLNELISWNKRINLTAITDVHEIIVRHFQDSLVIKNYVNFDVLSMIADVGTGAGFPGIPLKIIFPHLSLVLIEVNQKKIKFLETIIQDLSLQDVEVCPLDWRTFLRKTEYPIELFCARASLVPQELIRMFNPSCFYRESCMVYWASSQWKPSKKETAFIKMEERYDIDHKKRKLIFFTTIGTKKGLPIPNAFLKGKK